MYKYAPIEYLEISNPKVRIGTVGCTSNIQRCPQDVSEAFNNGVSPAHGPSNY